MRASLEAALLDGNGLYKTRFGQISEMPLSKFSGASTNLGQVPREINVDSVHDGQVVGQQLQGQDVDQSLQTVHGQGYSDGSVLVANGLIVVVADDNCDKDRLSSAR